MRAALIAALLALAAPARALQSNVGTTAADFLTFGAGARALGMGEAYTAVADGPDAAYWNPAGLGRMARPEALYARAEPAAGLHHDFLAVAAPSALLHGTVGFALTRLTQDGLTLADASDQKLGSFSPHSESYAFAYGSRFADDQASGDTRDYFRDDWNVPAADKPLFDDREPWTGEIDAGFALKVVREDLGTRVATAYAFDGGGVYRPTDLHELLLGAAVRNVGTKIQFVSQSEALPGEAAVGAGYELRLDQWRVLPVLEVDAPYAGSPYGKLGAEATYLIDRGISATGRLGYDTRPVPDLGYVAGLTFGVGVRYGSFAFDAGFQPLGVLGEDLRVGVGWKF